MSTNPTRTVLLAQVYNNPTSVAPVTVVVSKIGPINRVEQANNNLMLVGSGGTGQGFTYTASGLPAGLTLNSATGAITGIPTTLGHNVVTVTATDSGANSSGNVIVSMDVVTRLVSYTLVKTDINSWQVSLTGATGTLTWTGSGFNTGWGITTAGVIGGSNIPPFTSGVATITATDSGTGDTFSTTFSMGSTPSISAFGIPGLGSVNSPLQVGVNYPEIINFPLSIGGQTPIKYTFDLSAIPWASHTPNGFGGTPTTIGVFSVPVVCTDYFGHFVNNTVQVNIVAANALIQPQQSAVNVGTAGPVKFNIVGAPVTNDGVTMTVDLTSGQAYIPTAIISYSLTAATTTEWWRIGTVPLSGGLSGYAQEHTVFVGLVGNGTQSYYKFRLSKSTFGDGTDCEYELLGGFSPSTGIINARVIDAGTNLNSYLDVQFGVAGVAYTVFVYSESRSARGSIPFSVNNPAVSQGTGAAGSSWACGATNLRGFINSTLGVLEMMDLAAGNKTFNGYAAIGDGAIGLSSRVTYSLTPAGTTTWYRIGDLPHPSGSNGQECTVYVNVNKANGTSYYKFRISKTTKDGLTPSSGTLCEYELIGAYQPGVYGIANARVVEDGVNLPSHLDVQFLTTDPVTINVIAVNVSPSYSDTTHWFTINSPAASQGTGATGTSWACGNTNRKVIALDNAGASLIFLTQAYSGGFTFTSVSATSYGNATNALGTVGASATADFTKGMNTATLTSAVATAFAFTAPPGAGLVEMEITAAAAGTNTAPTYPASVIGTPAAPNALGKKVTNVFFYTGATGKYIVVAASASY